MSDKSSEKQFLEVLATEYKFYGDTRTAFLGRFAPENANKPRKDLKLTWQKEDLLNPEQKLQEELQKIYSVLRENGCDIPETSKPGRFKQGESPWQVAYKWLWEVKFPEWKKRQTDINTDIDIEKPSAAIKRYILGLKGSYQKAKEKLTEITEYLQNYLKDQNLKLEVEEGSIILIVESSQAEYKQFKALVGRKIAGFPVEYTIDAEICGGCILVTVGWFG